MNHDICHEAVQPYYSKTLQQLYVYERSNFSIHKTFEHKIFKDCLKFT